MSLPEKVLMRKIKKREKRKQELSEAEPEKKKVKADPPENDHVDTEACMYRLTISTLPSNQCALLIVSSIQDMKILRKVLDVH